jgi:hypothetical protein
MSTVVTTTAPTRAFALRETLADVPDAAFETLNVAAHNHSRPMSLLWATAPDLGAVDCALRNDTTVEAVRTVTSRGGQRLYRLR